MNRAKGGGWEFLDYLDPPKLGFTWSAGSGCNVQCGVRSRGVCWAEKIVKRLGRFCPLCPSFKPHLHDGKNGTPNKLDEPLKRKKSSTITPISTGDLFGLPYKMTQIVLDVIEKASWHTFPTLTKAPQNAWPFIFPDNMWFGITINEQGDVWRLECTRKNVLSKTWAIFEPLYSAINYDLSWLNWIIIGPQSNPVLQPKKEWIQSIIDNAGDVPIFMKSALDFRQIRKESPHSSVTKVNKNEL